MIIAINFISTLLLMEVIILLKQCGRISSGNAPRNIGTRKIVMGQAASFDGLGGDGALTDDVYLALTGICHADALEVVVFGS